MNFKASIFDITPVSHGETAADAFATSVRLARLAEELGYERVWYAEHHNMPGIASSTPGLVVAHVANHTSTIRLGAGGIMLPNHSPLTVAEQFGTLETLHPGRIDLGLGRAPGTDMAAVQAMRRSPGADTFPQDVVELQAYLTGASRVPGVVAVPGNGLNVPLYILGTSQFGAQLAAALGLPFAFGSHFSPGALQQAVATYRDQFRPSADHDQPYVIAGVNVVAAEDPEDAREQFTAALRNRTRSMISRGAADPRYSDDQIDAFLQTPNSGPIRDMLHYTAVGSASEVGAYLEKFAADSGADEVILAHQALNVDARMRSVAVTADAVGLQRRTDLRSEATR